MSTTYYELKNGKRRLLVLSLIVLTLLSFLLPWMSVHFEGKEVSDVSGLQMIFGQRGFSLLKDMGLDMGLSRTELTGMSIYFGYTILPLLSVIVPLACLLVAIAFTRSTTRGGAIFCAALIAVAFVSYTVSMNNLDGKRLITLRVAKRYIQEEAEKSRQQIEQDKAKLDAAKPEEKKELEAAIEMLTKKAQKLTDYYAFLDSKIENFEAIQPFTDIQDKGKMAESAKIEDEGNVSLILKSKRILGVNAVNIVQALMLLAVAACVWASIGKYKAGE